MQHFWAILIQICCINSNIQHCSPHDKLGMVTRMIHFALSRTTNMFLYIMHYQFVSFHSLPQLQEQQSQQQHLGWSLLLLWVIKLCGSPKPKLPIDSLTFGSSHPSTLNYIKLFGQSTVCPVVVITQASSSSLLCSSHMPYWSQRAFKSQLRREGMMMKYRTVTTKGEPQSKTYI